MVGYFCALVTKNSVDLRSVVRNHPGDQSILRDTIKEAIKYKPERHYFDPNRTDILRFMNLTNWVDLVKL